MTIVIIEDEPHIAWDLRQSIERLQPGSIIQPVLDSVEAGKTWFKSNPMPDLIFSDIQLGDGLAFDIFTNNLPACPLIFCTAYDEYAIEAFRHNAIDYLLKPIDEKALEKSLAKIALFRLPAAETINQSNLANALRCISEQHKQYKQSLLVTYRDKLIPVQTANISFVQLQHEVLHVHTADNHAWPINDRLDHLEALLDPFLFYRANRQTLVAYGAIKEIEFFLDRKLLLHLKIPSRQPIIVSKGRASDFIRWMDSH